MPSVTDLSRARVYAGRLAAFDAALALREPGPAFVELRDQALLHLASDLAWLPPGPAARLLRSMAQPTDNTFLGAVLPAGKEVGWIAVLRFVPTGHILDEDAQHWHTDDLLARLRHNTELGNARRLRRGQPAVEITGWARPPRFEAAAHRLMWSALSRYRGQDASGHVVSHNARALGREGYISLNLVAGSNTAASFEADAARVLAALHYVHGKDYADFDAMTDKLSPYGLGALVTGPTDVRKLRVPAFIQRWINAL